MNAEFDMSIEDVQETLDAETKRERIEIPVGEYVCEIKPPLLSKETGLTDVRKDSKGHNKIIMPIEISGNPELDGQWLFEAIYMNNQHDEAGKVKDNIGKRKVARYANAVGLKSLKNLNELEGNYVKVDYGRNKNGFNEVRKVFPFADDGLSSTPPAKEAPKGDDLPF